MLTPEATAPATPRPTIPTGVLAKATPAMSTDSAQKEVNNAIIGIGYLQKHFNSIIGMGNMARKSLQEAEQTREEILGEVAGRGH